MALQIVAVTAYYLLLLQKNAAHRKVEEIQYFSG
jgi:hypothetical protein